MPFSSILLDYAVNGRIPARVGRMSARCTAWIARRLIEARRWDEADVLVHAALDRYPDDRGLASAHALVAQSRGAYDEATRRWHRARQLGAKEPFASSRLAAALRLTGECAAAAVLIDDALALYPRDIRILTEAARLAQDMNRPQAAAGFWRRAITRAKPRADWLQGYARSLLLSGDLDGAARLVASARRRHPRDIALIATSADIAAARQDWARAMTLWTEYRRHAPDDPIGTEGLGYAVHNAGLSEIAESLTPAPVRSDIAVLEDEPMRRLMLQFESIGANCELGLVQRRFGAEPLGLLRWNDVALDQLVSALDCNLEGMGEPENTAMVTSIGGELYVEDRRWRLPMHTFLHADRVDPDDVFKKLCRRIRYLRDKLLEDLASAEKIFVYSAFAFTPDDLRRLHRALRAHGPVTLLGAQPVLTSMTAFPGRPVGEVEQLDESLFVGFLPRPPTLDAHNNCVVDFEAWTALLAKASQQAAGRDTSIDSARDASAPARSQ